MSAYLVLMVKTLTCSYLHKLHYRHVYNYVTCKELRIAKIHANT